MNQSEEENSSPASIFPEPQLPPNDSPPSSPNSSEVPNPDDNISYPRHSDLALQPYDTNGDTFCTELEGQPLTETRPQKSAKKPPGIPSSLLPFITHDPSSFTSRCLSGEKIAGLDRGISKSVVSDLYRYMNIAVDNDLIGEALYIQEIIDGLRADKVFLKLAADQSISELDRRIQDATDSLNSRSTQ
jgi:hypothetical protein